VSVRWRGQEASGVVEKRRIVSCWKVEAPMAAWNDWTGNPYWWGRLSALDVLVKIGCFVKKKYIASAWKEADLNQLVQGGQPHWSFSFSKDTMKYCRSLPILLPNV
jgi:hypothetical protein